MKNLLRANKLTVYHSGDGVMTGIFYKTNKKLGLVNSTDDKVSLAGYVEPKGIDADNTEGKDAVEVTPQQKLDSFREFLVINATVFGYVYDPVDRRPETERYPSSYNEAVLSETAQKIVTEVLTHIVNVAQEKAVDKLVEQGHLKAGTLITCGIVAEEVKTDVQELYKNGNLKYATVSFPVQFGLNSNDKVEKTMIDVQLVSGQVKKPRNMGQHVLTANGLKTLLIDAGILPKIEKPKEEDIDGDSGGDSSN